MSSVPKHCFVLSTCNFMHFQKMLLLEKFLKLESFFVKISPLRNFVNTICDVTCNKVLITLVNLCAKKPSICQGCNGPVYNNGLQTPPLCDIVVVIKMRREYPKDRKK